MPLELPLTESDSAAPPLESLSLSALLGAINQADQTVPQAVARAIPQIEALVAALVGRMQRGGRLFYLGSGTSGRLGIVDASEIPPTFGVPQGLVVGLIAGGEGAIRKAVEFAEDDPKQGWQDLFSYTPMPNDTLIGLSASGRTPYVVGAVRAARAAGLLTGCITANTGTELAAAVEFPVEVDVGPEVVTASTRMKAGTAQKLVLNMISTAAMVQLGHVAGSRMVDMQLANDKLIDRGTRYVAEATGLDYAQAKDLLLAKGSVRKAVGAYKR